MSRLTVRRLRQIASAIALSLVLVWCLVPGAAFWSLPAGVLMGAVAAVFRQQSGTEKTWKASGGDYAITMDSTANAAAREGAKGDLGATFGVLYAAKLEAEFASAPTAGNRVDVYWNPSNSGTAGTNNVGGCSGTDAAYAGYSSNLAASLPQLIYIGSMIVTAQGTATVQKARVGFFTPPTRYGSPVIVNNSAVGWVSNSTNTQLILTPEEDTQEAS